MDSPYGADINRNPACRAGVGTSDQMGRDPGYDLLSVRFRQRRPAYLYEKRPGPDTILSGIAWHPGWDSGRERRSGWRNGGIGAKWQAVLPFQPDTRASAQFRPTCPLYPGLSGCLRPV